MDSSICKKCNTEKIYDEYHRMYKRCATCNNNQSLKYYYKNKDRILERLKDQRQNDKERINNTNKERNSKYKSEINALKEQIQILTNRLNTITVN